MIITGGKFKGQKIIAPDEKITRPTLSKVRMGIFNTLQSMIDFEGKSFLDMYAGSGIMGLEAISRGFSKSIALEKNLKSANIIKQNFKKFETSPKLIIGDSLRIISTIKDKFDVIFIDPPYSSGIYEKSLEVISEIAKEIVVLEHTTDINFENYRIIKQKKYADKIITFLELA